MSVVLDRLSKRYGRLPVVNNVSLEVGEGEFFVLLGPSGSGKSTVLRIIAGLTERDGGAVLLHGRDVTDLPPQKRGVGFVFQHYALFRHMTVAENVEFALKIRRVAATERRRRRDELLELVGLAGLGERMPGQLSGGQQQRVARARALAHRPEVLLLDEPFGALDARIRTELRRAVKAIQRELGVTTLFVTHDQEEAFELADRMGVMNFGRLLEVGPPEELYLRPATEFVATFLGTANLMVGEATPDGVRLGPVRFPLPTQGASDSRRVQVLFRPEDVAVKTSAEAVGWPLLGEATVEETDFVGSFERLRLRLPRLAGVRPISPPAPFGGDFFLVEATRSQHQARRFPLEAGQKAWVGVRRLHALTHPGLSFLMLTDGTELSRAAISLGAQIARLAHARVTLLGHGGDRTAAEHLQDARESLGSGLASVEALSAPDGTAEAIRRESTRQHHDLAVQAHAPGEGAASAESTLEAFHHHLLLVPGPVQIPSRVLVCVAVGEPGKDDVLFTARLVRHLGAEATILTVLPREAPAGAEEQADRFLAAGVRTMGLLGVTAHPVVRHGSAREEILKEMREGGHGMLVVGAPLADRRGKVSLTGLVESLLSDLRDRPVLVVRSHEGEASP